MFFDIPRYFFAPASAARLFVISDSVSSASKASPSDGATTERDPDWSSARLGDAIRVIRTMQGISLAELAARSKLSLSFLSTVENGLSDISVGRLARIARALEVDAAQFMAAGQAPSQGRVVRSSSRLELPHSGPNLHVSLLAPSRDKTFTFAICRLQGGGVVETNARFFGAEAFLFILDGAARIDLTTGEVSLERGDSITFDTDDFERIIAVDQPCDFLWMLAATSDSA